MFINTYSFCTLIVLVTSLTKCHNLVWLMYKKQSKGHSEKKLPDMTSTKHYKISVH